MHTRSIRSRVRATALLLVTAAAHPCLAQTQAPTLKPALAIEAPRLVIDSAVETPVSLRAVRVQTRINGRSALTEVTLTFHNANPRRLEGELQFPLQPGQSVVGMAMDVGGVLREAVPVDKARGEAVFEAVTRSAIDPALVSQTQGDNARLRVYPIEPHSDKTVVLRYAEWLGSVGAQVRYRLPLGYARRLPAFALQVVVEGASGRPTAEARGLALPAFTAVGTVQQLALERRDAVLAGALAIAFTASTETNLTTERRDGRDYFIAQLPIDSRSAIRVLPRSVTIVWDSSGSGAGRDHGREFALLAAYFAKARDTEVRLVRLRDVTEPAQRFSVKAGDWRALRSALEATVYDGATDLGAFVPLPEVGAAEVLLFSDGLSNYGVQRFADVKLPVYAIAAASRIDSARLRDIGERSGGRFIDLMQQDTAAAAASLLSEASYIVAIESNGATQLVAASPFATGDRVVIGGELTAARSTVRVRVQDPGGRQRTVELAIDAGRGAGPIAAQAWARLRVAALDADYALNRAEIRRLGTAFGIVTRETSLIVLDRAQDYARHGVAPPPELANEVARHRSQIERDRASSASAQLERVVKLFEARQAWWAREFPKDALPATPPTATAGQVMQEAPRADRQREAPMRPSTLTDGRSDMAVSAAPVAAAPAQRMAKSAGSSNANGRVDGSEAAPPLATIRLLPVPNNAPYAARLRAAPDAGLYRVYLDERASWPNSTAFILDVAERLFERGQTTLALRVLSNLAEMDLENRQVLRILGTRLVQMQRADLAVPALRQVLLLAPDEPQSQRDLGLALAASGQPQAAVDALYEVARRQWPRFAEIELIALTELNAIVAAAERRGTPLVTTRIDPRLLKNLPLDLRVTLAWDTDNTDIDLWVTDPNGERAFYGHPLSRQGGRVSRDITGGYGPEEFGLRRAVPGKYTVTAQYYGHRQQVVSGATTVQLTLATGFGSAGQKEQAVTLRLNGTKDQVQVGEFEVAPQP
jgi:Ca-activated chloride channel homolog